MTDIVFVVLNYNIYKETVDLINSIRKNIDTPNYRIIIVDNHSTNDTGKRLCEKYSTAEDVLYYETGENLGFARGNNFGIEKARELQPKYICCTNNDVILPQKDFYAVLEKKYTETNAAVISPLQFKKDYSLNEPPKKLRTTEEYQKQIDDLKEDYRKLKEGIVEEPEFRTSNPIKRALLKNPLVYKINLMRHIIKDKRRYDAFCKGRRDEIPTFTEKNIIASGAFLVFTPVFFEKLTGFCPETFMYYEEDLLYMDVTGNGMDIIYTSELYIRHLENVSTDAVKNNRIDKLVFVIDQLERSFAVLRPRIEALK